MSGPKVLGGIAAGVAAGTLFGFYVLAPNVEGGPAGPDSGVQEQLDETTDSLDAATAGLDADDAVLDGVADDAVSGALRDREVLVVALPDVDPDRIDAQRDLLTAAGAGDAGTLRLSADAVDQGKGDAVKSLTTSSLPAGAKLSEDRRDPGYHLGELLGQALRTGGDGAQEASASDRDLVLGALDKGGFLDGGVPGTLEPADAVVVLAGDDTGYAGTFGADLAAGLDGTTGGAVLAGTWASAQEGGALGVLRADRADTEAVSSVDNADRTAGRITVVRALSAQLEGKAGSYGAAGNASAPAL